MRTSTRTVYKCDHCDRRAYLSKSACVRHESICFGNPGRSVCPTCEDMSGRIGISVPGDSECPSCARWRELQGYMRAGKSFAEACRASLADQIGGDA